MSEDYSKQNAAFAAEQRRMRRDGFIKAALTGLLANRTGALVFVWESDVQNVANADTIARAVVDIADATIAEADREGE